MNDKLKNTWYLIKENTDIFTNNYKYIYGYKSYSYFNSQGNVMIDNLINISDNIVHYIDVCFSRNVFNDLITKVTFNNWWNTTVSLKDTIQVYIDDVQDKDS